MLIDDNEGHSAFFLALASIKVKLQVLNNYNRCGLIKQIIKTRDILIMQN